MTCTRGLFDEGKGSKGNFRGWDISARAARDSNRVAGGVITYTRTPNIILFSLRTCLVFSLLLENISFTVLAFLTANNTL